MAFTDEQKTKRFELENQQTPLTTAERFLYAALGDLREADETGNNIDQCEAVVKQAEKAVKSELKGDQIEVGETIKLGDEDLLEGGQAVHVFKRTLQ